MTEKKSNDGCNLPPIAPWLVYAHETRRKKKMQTFCIPSKSKCYSKSIPELRDKSIIFSNNGWLLLHDLNDMSIYSVWNPFSSQLINLPSLWGVKISCAIILPYPCHEEDNDDTFSVYLFESGTAFCYNPLIKNTWFFCTTEVDGKTVEVVDVITCSGIVYGLTSICYIDIVVMEFNHNGTDFVLRRLAVDPPDGGFPFVRYYHEKMVESCGKVYKVARLVRESEREQIFGVHVWELDSRLMKWVRIKCLNGRAFLIGNVSKCSTWCWGSTDAGGIQGNCVYFLLFDECDESNPMYSYNLKDSSVTSILPCPDVRYRLFSPTWVVPPQCQRFTGDEFFTRGVEKVVLLDRGYETLQSQLKEDEEALLRDLPYDLISRVAQQLHLFDYLNFRASCKLLNNVAPPATWGRNTSYPLLIFFESEDPLCKLMDPCRSDSHYMVLPESFRGVVPIKFAKDEFFLFRTDREYCLEFFNPFTRVRGKLPSFEDACLFSSVGFSTFPTSSDCVTVGIIDCFTEVSIAFHIVGDERWYLCRYPQNPEVEFWTGRSIPAYYEGAFYFLDRRGYLGVFQLIDKERLGTWEVYDKPQVPANEYHSSYLVECDGMLLSVFIQYTGKWVRVFKLQLPDMIWVPVESLGNYTMFLSPSSSLAMAATRFDMRNRIYLSRLYGDDVLFYSLDKGKYSTYKGEDWIEDFYGTKEYIRCSWI